MDLPKKGKEVALSKIKEICEFYGLHDLWNKIEKDPPPKPFKSDGCSMWFGSWQGITLFPACFLHDLKYLYFGDVDFAYFGDVYDFMLYVRRRR